MADRVRMRWTKRREAVFLRVLGETCHVQKACAAAAISTYTVYQYRQRDAAFAAAWRDALAEGYHRLEEALLAHALKQIAGAPLADLDGAAEPGDPADADRPVARRIPGLLPGTGVADALTPASVQFALLMLNRHRASVEGGGKPMMVKGRRATSEETDAALTRQLDVLARRLRIEGGQ